MPNFTPPRIANIFLEIVLTASVFIQKVEVGNQTKRSTEINLMSGL